MSDDSGVPTPFATVRPSTAKLPTSLRVLFDNDEASSSDPFRIPGFNGVPRSNAPSPLPTQSTALPHSRDRSAIKRAMNQNNELDDGPSLSRATFAFPAANSRARTRQELHGFNPPEGNWDEADPSLSQSEQYRPPRRPSISDVDDETGVPMSHRPADNDHSSPSDAMRDHPQGHPDDDENASPVDEALMLPIRTTSIPNESRSSTSNLHSDDHSFVFPGDFQFPQTSIISTSHERLPDAFDSPSARRGRDRASPTHLSTSSINIPSPISHHPTHSLDVPLPSGIPRHQLSSGQTSGPPPLSRARSATPSTDSRAPDYNVAPLAVGFQPPSKKPSLTRLASVAVMETMQMPVTPPMKPFASRGRSGSSNSGQSDVALPGLKDVLKVSMSD